MAVASIAAKTPAATTSDMVARDAIIGWYKGEFAAANAIIDALCAHIVQITAAPSKYESVFAAIHRRRMNWIPVLNQQIFYPISDVSSELLRAASAVPPISVSGEAAVEEIGRSIDDQRLCGRASEESQEDYSNADYGKSLDADCADEGGSHRTFSDTIQICTDHEECVMRSEKIKISKGFVAKELVKGHMVNVVKGLKLYEDMFTNLELLKLTEYINELRQAGRRRELSGETFIFFNKQMKGNKREIIQLGVPLFQPTSGEAASSIEPIPQILQSVIDHLTQWRLIPESKRPNSCIINFFDEDEHSQPYFKPPHLENPISTLFLSETTIAFGRVLTSTDHNGDYKGSLTLPLLEGSLLVMRGNSADMARHVICPSPNKRVSITFLKVRPAACSIDITTPSSSTSSSSSSSSSSPSGQQSTAITLWQPPLAAAEMADIAYGDVHAMVPSWGLSLHSPLLMFGPAISPAEIAGQWRRAGRGGGGGTGVFLPWTVGPKRYPKHLPPRIQKRRLSALSLSQPLEAQPDKLSSLPPIMV